VGTATTGSSEAIQLGGLAMKRIWQAKRKAAGKSIHEPGPNIIMGANAQVALEKFARYFEVEMRLVPISVESKYRLDPKKAMEYVDENTIGVYVILGSMRAPSFGIVCFSDLHIQAHIPGTTNLLKKWQICSMSTRREPVIPFQSTV
jgi:glutamate/tyrosine decarboxylase-like PLP-dependent enzyme